MGMWTVTGNLFDSDADVLIHQVNTIGVMGAGIAKEVRARFPSVYQGYRDFTLRNKDKNALLGCALVLPADGRPGQYIANVYGQATIAAGVQNTDYDALRTGLQEVQMWMCEHGLYRVAVPCGLGCGLGNGDWNMVRGIIRDVFRGCGFEVKVWKLPK